METSTGQKIKRKAVDGQMGVWVKPSLLEKKMRIKVGISKEVGLVSAMIDDEYGERLGDEDRKKNAFSKDGWTVTVDLQAGSLVVKRPKVGKCPAVTETFTLQDGTLYLKAKNKVAEAKFVVGDLSVLIWKKYGIREICYADPNRTYQARFREDQRSEEGAYGLVWTHTDGEVSVIERGREQHTEEVVRYGRLDFFEGNVRGLYVDEVTKSSVKVDRNPITMKEAIKAFNNDEEKALAVNNANFVVVFAMNPTYQILNYLCVLYTAEKDHRKLIEMLDNKIASDRLLKGRGFNLCGMALDYWAR